MAVAAKTIAAGKLGTALATLYTVPASKAARVTQIVYGNTDTSNSYSADLKRGNTVQWFVPDDGGGGQTPRQRERRRRD
jgi:hypothetical protein